MSDAVEVLRVSLAVLLGGAAVAIGAQVIRSAWRDAPPAPHRPEASPARPEDTDLPLRGIAAFEAIKALVVLAAVLALLAFASRPTWIASSLAIVGRLGVAAREQHALGALDLWLASERGPLLLGTVGYAALHLVEAWGLWHLRPWGEALGAASGAVYLPFEIGHLLHRPGLPTVALLSLNLAVVVYLVRRLRTRTRSAG